MARLTFARKRAEDSLHGEGCLKDVQTAFCTSAIRWCVNLYCYFESFGSIYLKRAIKTYRLLPLEGKKRTLLASTWQFEGGKCPLTYPISCTVFLAPYALQIANSRLDLKNLEDTVKLGVYSPTSLTGPRTTGAPAQEIHGNSISVACVVHIFLLFIHFLPLVWIPFRIIFVAYYLFR